MRMKIVSPGYKIGLTSFIVSLFSIAQDYITYRIHCAFKAFPKCSSTYILLYYTKISQSKQYI